MKQAECVVRFSSLTNESNNRSYSQYPELPKCFEIVSTNDREIIEL